MWLLRRPRQNVSREDVTVGVDQALVREDELGTAESRTKGCELVGVPAVVVVAERDQLGLGRNERREARSKLR